MIRLRHILIWSRLVKLYSVLPLALALPLLTTNCDVVEQSPAAANPAQHECQLKARRATSQGALIVTEEDRKEMEKNCEQLQS